MNDRQTILLVSDIHHAGELERQRRDFEWKDIDRLWLRLLARVYFHYIWIGDPLSHAGLLDRFLEYDGPADLVVANGDFSCDSAFVGVSDDAACHSAAECLGQLRQHFGERFHATIGDHELGKTNLFAGTGGMRLASWARTTGELALRPFWRVEMGNYVLIGMTSSLAGLPVFEREALPAEWNEWLKLRERHLAEINSTFSELKPHQRVLLFCHDPTALPFLAEQEAIRSRFAQIEHTIIGHLHTNLVFRQSKLLAGMPTITFMGNGVRRMTRALQKARAWKPFNVRLCPALAGVELMNDGGYFTVKIDPEARQPAEFHFHPLRR